MKRYSKQVSITRKSAPKVIGRPTPEELLIEVGRGQFRYTLNISAGSGPLNVIYALVAAGQLVFRIVTVIIWSV